MLISNESGKIKSFLDSKYQDLTHIIKRTMYVPVFSLHMGCSAYSQVS